MISVISIVIIVFGFIYVVCDFMGMGNIFGGLVLELLSNDVFI